MSGEQIIQSNPNLERKINSDKIQIQTKNYSFVLLPLAGHLSVDLRLRINKIQKQRHLNSDPTPENILCLSEFMLNIVEEGMIYGVGVLLSDAQEELDLVPGKEEGGRVERTN